jgi:hypothetical protein
MLKQATSGVLNDREASLAGRLTILIHCTIESMVR